MRRTIHVDRVRVAALVLALGLFAAVATSVASSQERVAPQASPSIAERLGPRTWALAIPTTWLVAPLPAAREGDVLDVLGTRPGERAATSEVARGIRVLAVDDRVVIVELTLDDASAIAAARARGSSLVPILRSLR